MAEVEQAGRETVYLKHKIDSAEIDVGLRFSAVPLDGMCSTNCNEGDLWSPDEPYELLRPSFDAEYQPHRLHLRKSAEPQNYVKALLQSDSELEKLSRKIRSQLRQSEMVELAVEAEKAALAGEESFSGRPSTYGGEEAQDKVIPVKLRRRQTFTEGISYLDRKLKLLSLRDVTEVIPHFQDLHSHVRTHMRRRRVQEDNLFFQEDDIDSTHNQNLQLASDLAAQSMTFFENMTDLSKVQSATQRIIDRSGACSPNLCDTMADDDSQASGASNFERFGKALSSHLSPRIGRGIKRPPLVVPTGLSHPDDVDFPVQCEVGKKDDMDHSLLSEKSRTRLVDRALQKAYSLGFDVANSQQTGVNEATPATVVKAEPSAAPIGVLDEEDDRIMDSDDESLELGISLVQRTSGAALFDVDGDDVSSCPPSPSNALDHLEGNGLLSSQRSHPVELTPQLRQPPKPEKHFLTPARLRRMRELNSPRSGDQSCYKDADNKLTTPEAAKSAFEPSSIIDTGEPNNEGRSNASSIHEEHTAYLALPSMRNPNFPNEQAPAPRRVFPETEPRRNFKYPQRQSLHQATLSQGITASPVAGARPCGNNRSLLSDGSDGIQHTEPNFGSKRVSMIEFEGTSNSTQVSQGNPPRQDTQRRSRSASTRLCDLRKKADERRQDDSSGPTICSTEEEPEPLSSSEHSSSDGKGRSPFAHVCPNPNDGTGPSRDELYLIKVQQSDMTHHSPARRGLIHYRGVCTSDELDLTIGTRTGGSDDRGGTDDNPASGSESIEKLVVDSTSGATNKGPAAAAVVQVQHDPDAQGLQNSLSWPRIRKPFVATSRDLGDTTTRTVQPRNPEADKPFKRFKFGLRRRRDYAGVSEHVSRGVRVRDDRFQRVVEDMIANLSPTSSKRFSENYFSDAENNEFLTNYFYCVKSKAVEKQMSEPEGDHSGRDICRDALCSNIGMENMLSGISFLFPDSRSDPSLPAKPAPVKTRALSLGNEDSVSNDGWLGMLRMNSSRFILHFNRDEGGDGGSFRFQPPCLKKSSHKFCSRAPPTEPSLRCEIKATKLQKVMNLSKNGVSSLSNDERWNIIQSSTKDSSDTFDGHS